MTQADPGRSLQDGATWAYRLFLNREPESVAAIQALTAGATGANVLRWRICASDEFRTLLDRAGHRHDLLPPVDWTAGIVWAFQLFFDREPSEAEVQAHLGAIGSLNDLRRRLLTAGEFDLNEAGLKALLTFSVVNAFAPFPGKAPVEGAFRDFLGSIVKVGYLDAAWAGRAGSVETSVPRTGAESLHGTSEWVGMLRAVLEADEVFTVMELGAGWAPWLIVADRAARHRGDLSLDLTAVEGSAEHIEFMADNFRTNGMDPTAHRLLHAVVGAEDGEALFPKLHVGADDYGANAVFEEGEAEAAAKRGELERVRQVSLAGLMEGKTRVDVVHIDVQGHEVVVVEAAIDALNDRCRRLVIGTHSRTIEDQLFALLNANGWRCESELACVMRQRSDGYLHLSVDGEQVWRNPRV